MRGAPQASVSPILQASGNKADAMLRATPRKVRESLLYPRFCDWPKQARCKAREMQLYAHTANLPQRSRLPVFDNPEGFDNRLLFSSDVAFIFL